MAGQRHLKPVEAAALLQRGLVAVGYTSPESQVDAVISVLRARFARSTVEEDRLVAEVLRVFGLSESVVWAVLKEWCEEFERDEGEVFEHLFAPSVGEDRGDGGRR